MELADELAKVKGKLAITEQKLEKVKEDQWKDWEIWAKKTLVRISCTCCCWLDVITAYEDRFPSGAMKLQMQVCPRCKSDIRRAEVK
jgi:hypothetical protein